MTNMSRMTFICIFCFLCLVNIGICRKKVGDTCTDDPDNCAAHLHCVGNVCTELKCSPGDYEDGKECRKRKEAGESCTNKPDNCLAPLHCVGKVCTAELKCKAGEYEDGAMCKRKKDLYATCSASIECKDTLKCIDNNCDCSHTGYFDQTECKSKKAKGAACSSSIECKDPLKCIVNKCDCSHADYFDQTKCKSSGSSSDLQSQCTKSYIGMPACSFDREKLCPGIKSKSMDDGNVEWKLTKKLKLPSSADVLEDSQPGKGGQGSFVYLDTKGTLLGSKARLVGSITPSNITSVCIKLQYATKDSSGITVYNHMPDGSSEFVIEYLDRDTGGNWKECRFETCVWEKSQISFESENKRPTSLVAMDYWDIRQGKMDCFKYTAAAMSATRSPALTTKAKPKGKKEGEKCSKSLNNCMSSLYCVEDTCVKCEATQYHDGTSCRPRKKEGEKCSKILNNCKSSLYCVEDTCNKCEATQYYDGTSCQPRKKEGEKCSKILNNCKSSLYCVEDTCNKCEATQYYDGTSCQPIDPNVTNDGSGQKRKNNGTSITPATTPATDESSAMDAAMIGAIAGGAAAGLILIVTVVILVHRHYSKKRSNKVDVLPRSNTTTCEDNSKDQAAYPMKEI